MFQPTFLHRAGCWFLSSGIQDEHGGVARYYRSDIRQNLPVSSEITGYAASTLGLIVVLMTALAWLHPREGRLPVRLTTLLLVTVVAQGILGMLTVTWLLKPLIVTLHLLGGMTTLALLWWL